jgi:AcrR family transcriptional regulator
MVADPTADRHGLSEPLDVAAATAELGVSRQTLHRWEREGRLARVDPQGPPRFTRRELHRAATAPRRRGRDDARTAILEAAASLVIERGSGACTIDAVAERVGRSRGGVLHHFPHKEALLAGLADAFVTRFEQRWQERTAATGDRVAAYLTATLEPGGPTAAALLVCATERVEQVTVIAAAMRRWYAELDRVGGGDAVVRALAVDALWLLPLLGVEPLDEARRAELTADLTTTERAATSSPG